MCSFVGADYSWDTDSILAIFITDDALEPYLIQILKFSTAGSLTEAYYIDYNLASANEVVLYHLGIYTDDELAFGGALKRFTQSARSSQTWPNFAGIMNSRFDLNTFLYGSCDDFVDNASSPTAFLFRLFRLLETTLSSLLSTFLPWRFLIWALFLSWELIEKISCLLWMLTTSAIRTEKLHSTVLIFTMK